MAQVTPEEVLTAINLAEKLIALIEQEVAALRGQSGLTDDQILDAAKARNDDEHARAQAFLAKIGQS